MALSSLETCKVYNLHKNLATLLLFSAVLTEAALGGSIDACRPPLIRARITYSH